MVDDEFAGVARPERTPLPGNGRASCLVVTFHSVRPDARDSEPIADRAAARYTIRLSQLEEALGAVDREVCCTASEFVSKPDGHWLILTFDDGLISDYELVLPSLVRRGLHGTFFVTADNIGRDGYVNGAHLREMVKAGMEIGSHGLTHRYLITMPRHEAIRELCESKVRIEQALGVNVTAFAPAGGHFSKWMLRVASEAGYTVFATMVPGRTESRTGFVLLRRNHIQSHHDSRYISRVLQADGKTLVFNQFRYSLLRLPKAVLRLRNYDRLKDCLLKTARGSSSGRALASD